MLVGFNIFHENSELRKGGGNRRRKKVLDTNKKNYVFLTSNIFFTLLPEQDGLGQKFTQQKRIPENHKHRWHLPKTDIKSSGVNFYADFLT